MWLCVVILLIIFRTYIRHISTAINLTIYFGIFGNLNYGFADDTSHVEEVGAFRSLWRHTCTTAENIAIDVSAFHKNLCT